MLTFRLTLTLLTLMTTWSVLLACQPAALSLTSFRSVNIGLLSLKAGCQVQNLPASARDPLALWLQHQPVCPEDVHQFRQGLLQSGARLKTTQVANRGFHNPKAGSFSLFETVTGRLQKVPEPVAQGEFFFGHFTEARDNVLSHQDQPAEGALMIELIAWDEPAGVFRFYEMIGNGQQGHWFYRGDSLDIQADLKTLHLQADPETPVFGNRLRCSACHTAGGPIMKELAAPHNDWWTARRPLPLAQAPDAQLRSNLATLVEPEALAESVKVGMQKLFHRQQIREQERSLPEQLRPLFCAEEVNLMSDPIPQGASDLTRLPSQALVDPRLLSPQLLPIPLAHYQQALKVLQARFPENGKTDGDHPWLSPVKGAADIQAIRQKVKAGLLDAETVADVLAVDMFQPVVSPTRCGLLKTLPTKAHAHWRKEWEQNLEKSALPGARTLLRNLQDPTYSAAFHRQRASTVLKRCQTPSAAVLLLNWVGKQRQQIFDSELAKHPRGQIFEPGFRVVFPVMKVKSESDLGC